VTGKKERQRKLARERMLRQQQRRSRRAHQARRTTIVAVICVVVVGLGVGGFFAFAGFGGAAALFSMTSTPP